MRGYTASMRLNAVLLSRIARLALRALPYGLNGLQATASEAKERVSTLARLELELARAESAAKVRVLARALGLGALALVALVFGLGAALAGAALGLATVLPEWVAALCIAGGLMLVAIMSGALAVRSAKRAGPPVPARTITQLRETVQSVRGEST